MLNNGNKTNCEFTDEIVSYLYDEIDAADRRKFETHFAQCVMCTDEFAAVSNARFSVFEWQREEFAHLPTPQIAIPYAAKPIEETAQIGLLTTVRGWLSLVNSPIAVAAGLMVFLGAGFLLMTYFGRGGQKFVSGVSVPPVESANAPVVSTLDTGTPEIRVAQSPPVIITGREIRQVNVVKHRRPRIERQTTVGNPGNRNSTPAFSNAPVLSSYDNNDDASLRLADLFDDVGG